MVVLNTFSFSSMSFLSVFDGPSVIVLFSNYNTKHSDPLEGFLFLFSLYFSSNCGTRLSISATSMLSLLCFNTKYSICCSQMLFSSSLLWELHGVSVVLLNCNTIVILLKAFSFSSLCTSPLTVAPDLVFRQLQCFIFSASTPDIVFVALECFLFLFPSLGPSVIVLFSNCNTRHSDPLEGFLFLFSL